MTEEVPLTLSVPDSPYPSPWDDLPLPGNTTIGKCDADSLRRIFAEMEIPDTPLSAALRPTFRRLRYSHLLNNTALPSSRATFR
jgi:hypothetical protein